jgi:hypothetical protein
MEIKMKKLIILLISLVNPFFVFAVTYTNKTSKSLTISKSSKCTDREFQMCDTCVDIKCINCISDNIDDCSVAEKVDLLSDESVEFNNDQDQAVTIMSVELNDKHVFFPSNNSLNYEITVEKYPSKYSKITVNHANENRK